MRFSCALSSRAVSGPSSPRAVRGFLLIALAAVSWGTTGTATTFLVRDTAVSPLTIGVARLAVAALVLAALAWIGGSSRIARADVVPCLAMGACMAVFQAGYFTAVVLVGVALTALIAICSAPLAIAVLARIALGERLTRRAALALVIGVTGTALLIAFPRGVADLAPRFTAGVALALTAGVAYAVYVVIAKASVARSAPLPLAAATFLAGGLWLAPALLWAEPSARQIATGWPLLLYLGVVTTGLAYAAYTTGLTSVSAAAAGIVSLLEPLTATLLGVLLFEERLGAIGVAGAVLLLGAVAMLVREETR
ncbi:MAG: EamA family transporter [Candidatus Rokubacteria bacterium]|nr:EamA family transporter [Candidatus Rokubacteria bacterium]